MTEDRAETRYEVQMAQRERGVLFCWTFRWKQYILPRRWIISLLIAIAIITGGSKVLCYDHVVLNGCLQLWDSAWDCFCTVPKWQESECVLMNLTHRMSLDLLWLDHELIVYESLAFAGLSISGHFFQITGPVLRRTLMWVKGRTSLDVDMRRRIGCWEGLMQHRFEGAEGPWLDASDMSRFVVLGWFVWQSIFPSLITTEISWLRWFKTRKYHLPYI